jgi:hypothetical protein
MHWLVLELWKLWMMKVLLVGFAAALFGVWLWIWIMELRTRKTEELRTRFFPGPESPSLLTVHLYDDAQHDTRTKCSSALETSNSNRDDGRVSLAGLSQTGCPINPRRSGLLVEAWRFCFWKGASARA